MFEFSTVGMDESPSAETAAAGANDHAYPVGENLLVNDMGDADD